VYTMCIESNTNEVSKMSRSKSQKAKRSRNQAKFNYVARSEGVVQAVKTCDLRGVSQTSYIRAYREWCEATALEYSKRPSSFRPEYEEVIRQRGGDFYGGRQFARKMDKPLVHIRTTTRHDRAIKNARRHYRKVMTDTGWTGRQVDTAFAKHFPSEWALIQLDKHR